MDGISDSSQVDPSDYIITRKRKKYRFALFHNSPICYEFDEWDGSYVPQVVEIGAGTGLFSVEQATAVTEPFSWVTGGGAAPTSSLSRSRGGPTDRTREGIVDNYLAVDVKADRLQKGANEAMARGLTNIRFLRSRVDLLTEKLPAHSVNKLWITFPDPFAKKRSAKRRLTHQNYLKLYEKLLSLDGALYFKTDATDLFTWSLEQLVGEGWTITELSFDLHESTLADWYKIKTTYEAKFVAEGLKINFVKATPPKGE